MKGDPHGLTPFRVAWSTACRSCSAKVSIPQLQAECKLFRQFLAALKPPPPRKRPSLFQM